MNNVTGLDISKQLVPIMGDMITDKQHYRRGKTRVITGTSWGEWSIETVQQHVSSIGYPYETVPAYSLTDLLSVMPNEIPAKEGKPYVLCLNYLRYEREEYRAHLRGYVSKSLNKPFKKGRDRLTVANAARLILWLGEQGHMTKEGV